MSVYRCSLRHVHLVSQEFCEALASYRGTSHSHEPTEIDLILVLGSSSVSFVSFLVVLFLITSSIILVGGIVSGGAWYLSRTAMGPTSV